MNLKFENYCTTNFEPKVILDKIITILNYQGYIITVKSKELIEFKDNDWAFRSNFVIFKRVDNGKFEIFIEEDVTGIKYTYFISYKTEVIISLIIIFFGIFVIESFFVFVPILVLWIQLLFRINSLKSESEAIIASLIVDWPENWKFSKKDLEKMDL